MTKKPSFYQLLSRSLKVPAGILHAIYAYLSKGILYTISVAELLPKYRSCSIIRRFGYLCIFGAAIAVVGCQTPAKDGENTSTSEAAVADFSHQVKAEYAEGFQITYHKNYKLLEILQPFQDRVDTLRYSLVPRELAGEVTVPGTREVSIPVRSLITTSTTHIGFIEMLEAADVITGIASARYIYSKEIRDRLEEGDIVGFPQDALNKEKVVAMNPDLLMISGGESSQFDNFRMLRESGIEVLVNAEWLETTPLGKAEWVKVIAALLDREELGNKAFNAVAHRYNELKAAVDTTAENPTVINNIPYKGAWFVSGGKSFVAQFLKDAGADYPWFDTDETGGLRKDFEVVYKEGLTADVWLNPGSAATKEEVLAKDRRFKAFKAFKSNEIYNNNKRKRPSGGNDYWESGVVHPERLLADLIKIFHPQVVPNHELYYYQKVQ